MGGKQSGIYQIQPQFSSGVFFVQCDMETRGGGWTVHFVLLNIVRDVYNLQDGFR